MAIIGDIVVFLILSPSMSLATLTFSISVTSTALQLICVHDVIFRSIALLASSKK